jgi:tRNA (mo5U34)-methyltransferase
MNVPNTDAATMQKRVDEHPFWYHTMDIAPGVTTPGWFDLRHVVGSLPWPDVKGKRCLDIGTFDGFYAFEMERRGAAEVVAIDVEDHLLWDWPPDYRSPELERHPGFSGPPKGAGFRLIRDLIDSKVDWRPVSVYDITPELLGSFDVVVMGSLLIHLRDPNRALEAIRRVMNPDGHFLSADQIELGLTLRSRNRPLYTLNGSGEACQWFNYNGAGHERFLYAAGFEILKKTKPFTLRFNIHGRPAKTFRNGLRAVARKIITGGDEAGVLHQACLTRLRVAPDA